MKCIRGRVCSICGKRIFSSHALSQDQDEDEGAPLCGLCRRSEPLFVRATAYGSYDGGLRELIDLLKYASVRPAANVLGRMLAEAIDELECDFLGDRVAVVPVPLHRTKLRQRKFNHAELIAPGCDEKCLRVWASAFVRGSTRKETRNTFANRPYQPPASGKRPGCVRSGPT